MLRECWINVYDGTDYAYRRTTGRAYWRRHGAAHASQADAESAASLTRKLYRLHVRLK